MRCLICGKTIPDASRHCAYCGSRAKPAGIARRALPLWGVALLALGSLGGGLLIGGLGAEPTPQVIEKVVTQVVERVVEKPVEKVVTQVVEKPIEKVVTRVVERVVEKVVTPTPADSTSASTSGTLMSVTDVSPKDAMIVVYVPAGEFTMGSTNADQDATSDEFPQHRVYLDAFWIDRTEVTWVQYQGCVDAGDCVQPRCSGTGQGDHPVVCVSWQDAAKYCSWANRRLPTEAEWEKAASGTDERRFPWGDELDCSRLNYWSQAGGCVGRTSPVGSYPMGASPYGVLDMAGNVWEWVADWYNAAYYQDSPSQNPSGPDSGYYRVLRGGSWNDDRINMRVTTRGRNLPDITSELRGFRCARSG